MYTHRDHAPLARAYPAEGRPDPLRQAGIDGVLGQSWEDENGAIAATGFFTFLLGAPAPGDETARILQSLAFGCFIPESEAWLALLDSMPHTSYTRFKMAPPAQFDKDRLKALIRALPAPFSIRPIDAPMLDAGIVTEEELNIPHCFGSRDNYLRTGFGFAAMDGGRTVSVVSTYIVHGGEAEVDISTDEAYRRRGLAAAVCARFVLECLSRGLTPSWDAQNTGSVRLAEKLGFTLDRAYETYVLTARKEDDA